MGSVCSSCYSSCSVLGGENDDKKLKLFLKRNDLLQYYEKFQELGYTFERITTRGTELANGPTLKRIIPSKRERSRFRMAKLSLRAVERKRRERVKRGCSPSSIVPVQAINILLGSSTVKFKWDVVNLSFFPQQGESGPYVLKSTSGNLGEGSSGVVREGRVKRPGDKEYSVRVATKIIYIEKMVEYSKNDVPSSMSLKKEIEKGCNMRHKNIAKNYGAFSLGNERCIVMELCEGDLNTLLQIRHFSPLEKLAMAHQICQGLLYLHHKKIVHRDLKPENILYITRKNDENDLPPNSTEDESIMKFEYVLKLSDFGGSKCFNSYRKESNFKGTVEYSCNGVDASVALKPEELVCIDVYSFGVILWEIMINGAHRPFWKEKKLVANPVGLFFAIHNPSKPLRPDLSLLDSLGGFGTSQIENEVKKRIKELIGKCWSEDWKARPKNFERIGGEIEEIRKLLILKNGFRDDNEQKV